MMNLAMASIRYNHDTFVQKNYYTNMYFGSEMNSRRWFRFEVSLDEYKYIHASLNDGDTF